MLPLNDVTADLMSTGMYLKSAVTSLQFTQVNGNHLLPGSKR